MSAHFEIVRTDAEQPWHARLVATNGNIVLTSENYSRKRGALNAVAVAAEAFAISMNRPPTQDGPDRVLGATNLFPGEFAFDVREIDERLKR